MKNVFRVIFDWAEVWALLIPLAVLVIRKPKAVWLKPVVSYLLIALALNLAVDVIWYGNQYKLFRINNNIFYNIHSLARFLLFAWFFHLIGKPFPRLNRFVPILFLLVLVVIYAFIDKNVVNINSKALALESALLLGYCIVFYALLTQEDRTGSLTKFPAFWVVAGLSLFTAINFFIYLFFNYLAIANKDFSISIWDVHNFFYLVMCIFIAIAFRNER